jgi:hypothetical protein
MAAHPTALHEGIYDNLFDTTIGFEVHAETQITYDMFVGDNSTEYLDFENLAFAHKGEGEHLFDFSVSSSLSWSLVGPSGVVASGESTVNPDFTSAEPQIIDSLERGWYSMTYTFNSRYSLEDNRANSPFQEGSRYQQIGASDFTLTRIVPEPGTGFLTALAITVLGLGGRITGSRQA